MKKEENSATNMGGFMVSLIIMSNIIDRPQQGVDRPTLHLKIHG